MHDDMAFDQDSGDIPPLDLEHKEEKGQVRFHSIDDLSGAHLQQLRLAAGLEGSRGQAANALYAKALELLVKDWDIPGNPTLAIPRGANASRNLGALPLKLLRQMEKHVMKHLEPWLNEKPAADDGGPGSPPPPVRG